MKNRGFSPAKIVLVLLMFGALYMVSKTVTPPPKEAPKPVVIEAPPDSKGEIPKMVHEQADATKAASYLHIQEEQDKRAKLTAALEKGANHGKALPPDDDISSAYFHERSMGVDGQKEADADTLKRKQIEEMVQKKLASAKKPISPPN